jgi:hypothetical protein
MGVARWPVSGDGGTAGLWGCETRGGEGVWVKTRNRATVARFRVRRVKRQRRMVHGRGMVARTRRQQRRRRRGCGVAKHEGRGVWVCRVKWEWGMVRGGGTVERTRRRQQWGRAVAKHEEGWGGLGEKPETEPSWLGFRLQRGCRRWRGVL